MRSAANGVELMLARAHWLDRDLIAWPADSLPHGMPAATLEYRLHWSARGGINPQAAEPVPWSTAELALDPQGLPAAQALANPQLRGYHALRLYSIAASQAESILRGQVVVSAHLPSGRMVSACGVQIPRVLDALFPAAANARLGVSWPQGVPRLRLWAPTATRVRLMLWPVGSDLHRPAVALEMHAEPDGCWSLTGGRDWAGARFRYEVTVYSTEAQRMVTNQVTDPYSVALTVNSTHSLVVDLDDPALAPEVWVRAPQPELGHAVDQVIYELHVRDFSISDKSVPAQERGSFLAFARDSTGSRHLRRLADAGLNTVQLLPVFDNASVEEERERQLRPHKDDLRVLPPDSPEQQRRIAASAVHNGFNWGYDPWHYQAAEGSYCSSLEVADGAGRVSEFRTMVGSLHAHGLRVVLDMVFNHTASGGQDTKSVLDRIVPGYYHRLSASGEIETSTCCPNVATEHRMSEKLMVDSVVLWAKHYKVDGFRFDLMGHHSRDNMLAIRRALDALRPEADGVDGRRVTLYGEGWSFGEVAGNARFVQARQGQLGGTGIATFSDRLRDAVRGGQPFDEDPRVQGFGSGLMTATNGVAANGNGYEQRDRLLYYSDLISLGLVGNLRDYWLPSAIRRRWLRGDELDYQGGPAGYADHPDEVVSYVDAHDNETLFDSLTLKLHPATTMDERVRMNTLSLACATLGQSPVMWHAGTDILRSKSLDRNSYNSGDWFNYLDWTMTDNGFGAGLPPENDNGAKWRYLRPFLADPALKPTPEHIRAAHEQALDLLRVRASTRLFRMASAHAVRTKITFPTANTWQQIPGVILMQIDDRQGDPLDRRWSGLVLVLNGTAREVHARVPSLEGHYVLHPVQAGGDDEVVKAAACRDGGFAVPARSYAVFVAYR